MGWALGFLLFPREMPASVALWFLDGALGQLGSQFAVVLGVWLVFAQTRQPSGSFRIQRIGLGAIGPNRVDRLLAVLQRHFTLVFICFSQSISMKSSL